LHFVEEKKHAPLVAELAHCTQETVRRHDNAGLALDRLDQDGAGVFVDGGGERIDVAEVEVAETRGEGTEVGAVRLFGGEADDGAAAAVKIAARDDDFGAVCGNYP